MRLKRNVGQKKKGKVLKTSTITKEEETMYSKDPHCSNSILLQVMKITEHYSKSSVAH